MPSASVAEHIAIATDLKCSGCGNPIIKDGWFKCLRCKPRRLVLATLGKQDIACPRHDKPLVLMRYDRENDQYRAYCQKRGCPNYASKIGTLIRLEEPEMTQEAVAPSKNQELRDWLRGEIQRNERAEYILTGALNTASSSTNRYLDLTPDEMDKKMIEDRTKLKQIKERLEDLRSARELDVDIGAMERAIPGLKLEFSRSALRVGGGVGEWQIISISLSQKGVTMMRKGDELSFADLKRIECRDFNSADHYHDGSLGYIKLYFPHQEVVLCSSGRDCTLDIRPIS